ncbi:hypothetical protein SAMN02910417_00662 [Eubacterium oxidoreducens]|uniref:HD domain-containing protein n=2 Tax=Eubacterium oxidoreducens TaxID=1732 RepID=A0A1G6AL68_EUBOX|nr:hypothetical protein SAMN02910417_00662 [Eubacterium oxidoreducens]
MLAFALVAGLFLKLYIDEVISLVIFQLFFYLLVYAQLEIKRKEAGIKDLNARKYYMLVLIYSIGMAYALLLNFLPNQIQPFLLLALLLACTTDQMIGVTAGIYFSIVAYFVSNNPSVISLIISLSIICGGMTIYKGLLNKTYRKQFFVILFVMCVLFGCVATYYYEDAIRFKILIYMLIMSALNVILAWIFMPILSSKKQNINEDTYRKMLEDEYPLNSLMRQSSKLDYDHAKRVSDICAICATIVGADSSLAAAAGLYYRIGRLEGEPHVQNGVLIAAQFDFPAEITQILREFNGEEHLPSTVESAIVQIVDLVTAKFDVLSGQKATKTEWNREMIVYQALNEYSAKGMYDESGLSMNQFLKIRDYLVHLGGQ